MMSFPQSVAERALVACGRHCCLCKKFCGTKIELHHIQQYADGGEDTFDNCIPLCFDCHADMGRGDPRHPKGKRYTAEELRKHRDNWYNVYATQTRPISEQYAHSAEYETLRKQVSKVLSLYADRIYNPVDLARTADHKLPPYYDEASNALRDLAAELKSIAETMEHGYPITQKQMQDAAGYFFGLSNSLTVPYNQGFSTQTIKHSKSYEKHIREIFSLPER